MFREMRRSKQQLSQEETEAVLTRGTSGVLSVLGDGGYPYGVPLSYVYHDGKLYFHWALSGHKLDAVRACPKASFCVVDRDQVVPPEYTTYFRSAIAFGTVRVVEDPEEKQNAFFCWPGGTPRSSPRQTTSGRSTAFSPTSASQS